MHLVSAELAGMFRQRIPTHAFYDAAKNAACSPEAVTFGGETAAFE